MARTGRCAKLAAHRRAQNRYVAKNPAAQRRRARNYYRKHASEINRAKRAERKAGTASHHGHQQGRPREC